MNLQNELTNRLMSNSLENRVETQGFLTDVVFSIIKNHEVENRRSNFRHDAFILFQTCMLRSISIINLSKGFNYYNSFENSSLSTYDFLSTASLTRCILESYCNFNNIYIQSKNEKELELKYSLWVVAGLKNRQPHNPIQIQNQLKKENEAKQIEDIVQSIKLNDIFLALDLNGKKNIEKAIKEKKWQIKIEETSAKIVGWQQLLQNAGANDVLNQLYTILSWNTHPSNLSVTQFAEVYDTHTEQDSLRLTIEMATMILSFFINDYCSYFPETIKTLTISPILSQEIIKINNQTFRNKIPSANSNLK